MFNKIQMFLIERRLTSQFLLGFLSSESEIEKLVGSGRLFIRHGRTNEIEFIAFVSPGRRLHVQGSINGADLIEIKPLVEKFDLVGMNGPSPLVEQVLSSAGSLGMKAIRKQFDELVFTLEMPKPTDRINFVAKYAVAMDSNETLGFLKPQDFDSWHALYLDYLKEMEISAQASLEDRRARFNAEVAMKHHWGLWVDNRLVSIAAFISKFEQSAQIGGVYTEPKHRRAKGAKKVLGRMLSDAIDEHKLSELFLFTGKEDRGPRALYEGLGFVPKEKYTLIEFENSPS
jgi:hypothetical protein